MKFKKPTLKELNAIDMTPILNNIKECPEKSYVNFAAGYEHYRLLHWLAGGMWGLNIIELGCYMGFGTLCLAQNDNNVVTTYDIDFAPVKWHIKPNNVLQETVPPADTNFFPTEIANANLIFIDTWHNGIMEKNILEYLTSLKWSGILIYDDIFYNDAMIEFWRGVTQDKHDLTDIGHATGTGLIIL